MGGRCAVGGERGAGMGSRSPAGDAEARRKGHWDAGMDASIIRSLARGEWARGFYSYLFISALACYLSFISWIHRDGRKNTSTHVTYIHCMYSSYLSHLPRRLSTHSPKHHNLACS